MSSPNMNGRARALPFYDTVSFRFWMLAAIFVTSVALVVLNPMMAHAATNPCEGSDGIECIVPDSVDFSILGFVATPLTWILNALMVVISVICLWTLLTSGITFLRAVKAGNGDAVKKEGMHAAIALIILVLCSTGVIFTIVTGAISTVSNDIG